jgi:hypothetical protein
MNVTAIEQADSEFTDEQKQELNQRFRASDVNLEDVMIREDSRASIVRRSYAVQAHYARFNVVIAKVSAIKPMLGS